MFFVMRNHSIPIHEWFRLQNFNPETKRESIFFSSMWNDPNEAWQADARIYGDPINGSCYDEGDLLNTGVYYGYIDPNNSQRISRVIKMLQEWQKNVCTRTCKSNRLWNFLDQGCLQHMIFSKDPVLGGAMALLPGEANKWNGLYGEFVVHKGFVPGGVGIAGVKKTWNIDIVDAIQNVPKHAQPMLKFDRIDTGTCLAIESQQVPLSCHERCPPNCEVNAL